MKFFSTIVLYSLLIVSGIALNIKLMVHNHLYQNISKTINKNNFDFYRIGYFVGFYGYTIMGCLLMIIGIAGLLYTRKKYYSHA